MMKSKEQPYILFVAEVIYSQISNIKKKNPSFSNIDANENFIGSKIYNEISSGKFHDNWFEELSKNNFMDQKTKKKNTRRNNTAIKNSKRHDDQTTYTISKSLLYKKPLPPRNFSESF